MIDYKSFAFPKAGDDKPQWIRVYRDGREVLNLLTAQGKKEYRRRIEEMLERQGGLCCLCFQPLRLELATFEHQDGRGSGGSHRDDRITKEGKRYNGSACERCNMLKGSRRIGYNGYSW